MKKVILWVLLGVSIAVLGGFLLKTYQSNNSLRKTLTAAQGELQKANLKLGRAHTRMGVAEDLVKELSTEVQKEIEERKATIELLGSIYAEYATSAGGKVSSRIVYKDREVVKTIDLPKGNIYLRDKTGVYSRVTSLPFRYEDFRIQITGDLLTSELLYKMHQLFRGTFTETQLPDGSFNHYVEIFEVRPDGIKVGRIRLTKFEVIKKKLIEKRFDWFNPKLDIEIGYGLNGNLDSTWIAQLGMSFMSYGQTSNDLDWKFLRVAMGASRSGLILTGSPAQFNLAKFLPIFSNIWLVPSFGYDFSSEAFISTIGIGVTL